MRTEAVMRDYVTRLGGHKAISECVGVTPARVTQSIGAGQFPSSWFRLLKEMAGDRGIDLPDDLFSFKEPPADAA